MSKGGEYAKNGNFTITIIIVHNTELSWWDKMRYR